MKQQSRLFYAAMQKPRRSWSWLVQKAVAKGVNAGNAVKEAAPIFGGARWRPSFAQGGGTKPEKLVEAVKAAEDVIESNLRISLLFPSARASIPSFHRIDMRFFCQLHRVCADWEWGFGWKYGKAIMQPCVMYG